MLPLSNRMAGLFQPFERVLSPKSITSLLARNVPASSWLPMLRALLEFGRPRSHHIAGPKTTSSLLGICT